MVQTKRNQQTVQESVNTCPNSAKAADTCTNGYQTGIDNRPYKEQNKRYYQRNHCRNNGYASFPREKCQEIRKFRTLKFVIACSADNTGKNTDELVLDLSKSRIRISACNNGDYARCQYIGNYQP